jgi:hypothetical protein
VNKRKQQVSTGRGRLLFALDATASRSETWTLASKLQAEMLRSVARDTLDLKVAYYRGTKFGTTKWTSDGESLARAMSKIECITGQTQIKNVLEDALEENAKAHVHAIVLISDAMEENADELCVLASELGDAEVPCFMFHEASDDSLHSIEVANTYKQIAKRSGGEYFPFGTGSPAAIKKFADTLNAVAALAIGDGSAIAAIARKKGEII